MRIRETLAIDLFSRVQDQIARYKSFSVQGLPTCGKSTSDSGCTTTPNKQPQMIQSTEPDRFSVIHLKAQKN
ncbi:hypothetical protein ACU8KH_00785 [Lachancea thermotolerans]